MSVAEVIAEQKSVGNVVRELQVFQSLVDVLSAALLAMPSHSASAVRFPPTAFLLLAGTDRPRLSHAGTSLSAPSFTRDCLRLLFFWRYYELL